jgi:hypothetical protein
VRARWFSKRGILFWKSVFGMLRHGQRSARHPTPGDPDEEEKSRAVSTAPRIRVQCR